MVTQVHRTFSLLSSGDLISTSAYRPALNPSGGGEPKDLQASSCFYNCREMRVALGRSLRHSRSLRTLLCVLCTTGRLTSDHLTWRSSPGLTKTRGARRRALLTGRVPIYPSIMRRISPKRSGYVTMAKFSSVAGVRASTSLTVMYFLHCSVVMAYRHILRNSSAHGAPYQRFHEPRFASALKAIHHALYRLGGVVQDRSIFDQARRICTGPPMSLGMLLHRR